MDMVFNANRAGEIIWRFTKKMGIDYGQSQVQFPGCDPGTVNRRVRPMPPDVSRGTRIIGLVGEWAMRQLIEELAPLIEEAVAKSEKIREVSGGGQLILPRQALFLINKIKRLLGEEGR